MACTRAIFQDAISPSPYSCANRNPSQFLASKSILWLKKQRLSCSPVRINLPRNRGSPVVYAARSRFSKGQSGWKVMNDGIEAGINFVPNAIPRPIARIAVYYFALTLALKIIRSTSFYSLALMGLAYFIFKPIQRPDFPFELLNKGDDFPDEGEPLNKGDDVPEEGESLNKGDGVPKEGEPLNKGDDAPGEGEKTESSNYVRYHEGSRDISLFGFSGRMNFTHTQTGTVTRSWSEE